MKCMRNLNSSDLRPEVNTKNGVMLGRYRKTQSGAKFSSFTKIPYARPPVGNLRFALPEPAPPWQGVLDASKPCPKPVQNNYVTGLLEGQEDCLYINVYRPESSHGHDDDERDDKEPLPVMFWVYGGGFVMGDATEENYLPGPLLDTGDVIIVTGNYRVGPLGFMCLEDDVLPGNLALWDQLLMLRWVQENISNFGGNPGNVTVFGNSAGSFCIYCLYVSPHCEGLFHRVIAQSGPLISNSSPMQVMGKRPKLYARTYALSLGCDTSDSSQAVVDKLRNLPVAKLQSNFNIAGSWADMVPSPWKPLVDSWASNPFVPKNPRDALIDGEFNKVPLLTGVCSEEGIMMVSHLIREPERWNLLYKDDWWKHLLEITFHIHQEDATLEDKAILVDIMKAYNIFPSTSPTTDLITGNSPKASKKVLLGKLVDLFSDAYFKVGTLDTAQIVAEGEVPVYQYRFAYDGEWKFADLLTMTAGKLAVKFVVDSVTGRIVHGPGLPGVCHAEELHYLFSPTLWGMRNTLPSETDKEISKRMAAHWVTFSKYGDPSIPGEKWDRVTPGQTQYMEINERNSMKKFDDKELERFEMWKKIFQVREDVMPKESNLEIRLKPKPVLSIKYSHQYKTWINLA